MRGSIGSLNASVAGSILLYEATTQRGGPASAAAPAEPELEPELEPEPVADVEPAPVVETGVAPDPEGELLPGGPLAGDSGVG